LGCSRKAPHQDVLDLNPIRLSAALAVALTAFTLYHATLLPGLDFGDTGSFQTAVGSPFVTPRDGYPLYFAIGKLLLRLTHAEPARLLNVASAVEAAIACGLLTIVAAELSASTGAAIAAALLLTVSYTFWSQAIIAEVYALHAIFIALTLLLILRWAERPTMGRLALFFGAYALGFGNHLSMILLAPGYVLFLLLMAPRGWRSMFAPRVVALAIALAGAGVLQYGWSLRTLWLLPNPPHTLLEGLGTFWFDVTKSDWRDTMVLNVPRSMFADHVAMYWFDLTQQFGLVGPLLAVAGLARLAAADRRRAMLIGLLYAANVLFAYSYNVGDSHVFYLSSHVIVALLVAPGLTLAGRVERRAIPAAAALLMLYAGTRAYRDFPALDRSQDWRPTQVVEALTAGLDDRRAILLADLNWQVANGLSYVGSVLRPGIAYAQMPDVLLYAPALIADNQAIGRDVTLTERAGVELTAAYGPLLRVVPDPRVHVVSLAESVRALTRGTRYVMCVLRPPRDLPLDTDDIDRTLQILGGSSLRLPDGDYAAVAGRLGESPRLVAGSMRPFRRQLVLGDVGVEIRMESWLAADTIRRMGFGQVVAGRQHTLIVERGVSFAAFDERGHALVTAYRSNIFAPQRRYRVETHP
jgi:hypothetical protein